MGGVRAHSADSTCESGNQTSTERVEEIQLVSIHSNEYIRSRWELKRWNLNQPMMMISMIAYYYSDKLSSYQSTREYNEKRIYYFCSGQIDKIPMGSSPRSTSVFANNMPKQMPWMRSTIRNFQNGIAYANTSLPTSHRNFFFNTRKYLYPAPVGYNFASFSDVTNWISPHYAPRMLEAHKSQ